MIFETETQKSNIPPGLKKNAEEEISSHFRRIIVGLLRDICTKNNETKTNNLDEIDTKTKIKKQLFITPIILCIVSIALVFYIMGIKYAHAYTYCLDKSSVSDIYRIAFARLQEKCKTINDATKHCKRPSIDIDVSLLVQSRGYHNEKSNATYLINFSEPLIEVGFTVMMVFDGSIHHHSKRITTQRKADHERKKIEICWKL
jgi:hypothetical protein